MTAGPCGAWRRPEAGRRRGSRPPGRMSVVCLAVLPLAFLSPDLRAQASPALDAVERAADAGELAAARRLLTDWFGSEEAADRSANAGRARFLRARLTRPGCGWPSSIWRRAAWTAPRTTWTDCAPTFRAVRKSFPRGCGRATFDSRRETRPVPVRPGSEPPRGPRVRGAAKIEPWRCPLWRCAADRRSRLCRPPSPCSSEPSGHGRRRRTCELG